MAPLDWWWLLKADYKEFKEWWDTQGKGRVERDYSTEREEWLRSSTEFSNDTKARSRVS